MKLSQEGNEVRMYIPNSEEAIHDACGILRDYLTSLSHGEMWKHEFQIVTQRPISVGYLDELLEKANVKLDQQMDDKGMYLGLTFEGLSPQKTTHKMGELESFIRDNKKERGYETDVEVETERSAEIDVGVSSLIDIISNPEEAYKLIITLEVNKAEAKAAEKIEEYNPLTDTPLFEKTYDSNGFVVDVDIHKDYSENLAVINAHDRIKRKFSDLDSINIIATFEKRIQDKESAEEFFENVALMLSMNKLIFSFEQGLGGKMATPFRIRYCKETGLMEEKALDPNIEGADISDFERMLMSGE